MNSNAFSAADMTTAAASGHRDGYQAGYADAVKAVEVSKPAAAQEAVAYCHHLPGDNEAVGLFNKQTEHARSPLYATTTVAAQEAGTVEIIGRTYLLRDVTAALAKAGHAHAPVAAAPVDQLETMARQMFEAQADKLAAPWNRQWEPTKENWRKKAAAALKASTPAAPGIALHAPCTGAVYALARKLLWIAYVWNDHNFDHPYKIARKLAAEFGIESFDQANAWLDEQSKLIDASPKGGGMSDCPIIRLAPGEYTDWEKRVWRRGVIECATQSDIAAAMQATSPKGGIEPVATLTIGEAGEEGTQPYFLDRIRETEAFGNLKPGTYQLAVCSMQATSAEVGS